MVSGTGCIIHAVGVCLRWSGEGLGNIICAAGALWGAEQ